MATKTTKALENDIGAQDAQILIQDFEAWKAGDEYAHPFFGKDGAYAFPKVGTESYRLRHVHMVPLSDQYAAECWKIKFRRRQRKTSDRVLVYASSDNGDHLLIYILPEPDAHSVARMTTEIDKALMTSFAKAAEDFLFNGVINL